MMSDAERQTQLYMKMVATHEKMRECAKEYLEWQSAREQDDLNAACLAFGRITLQFGSEIME
jgi:hypothetical protein